jgi:hypothetical protein
MLSLRALLTAVFALVCGQFLAATALADGSVQGFVYAQGTTQGLGGVTIEVDSGCVVFSTWICASRIYATSASDGTFSVSNIPIESSYAFASAYYAPGQGNYRIPCNR